MLGVLRNRDFLAIWLGQLLSSLGDYFYFLAMPITILKLTGSTGAMGTALISLALPALVLGPLAGVMVDRWDRRRTMLAATVSRSLVVLLCLLVRSPEQVWLFYLVGILQSTYGLFFYPARNAAIPLIVRPDQLTTANGLFQLTMTAAMIAGGGLAGVTIQYLGTDVGFLADSSSYALATLCLLLARVPRTTGKHSSVANPVRSVLEEMGEGLQYLISSRTLVGLLLGGLVLNLGLGALNVVWVPFMQRNYGVGPAGLGLVDGAQGVGMALGSVAVGYLALRFRKVTLMGSGFLWAGGLLVLVVLAPEFGWVVLLMGLLGLALPLIMAAMTTITQLAVPDRKRGRISGLMGALTNVVSIVSMGSAGLLGEWLDLRWIYASAGAMVAAAGVVSLWIVEEPSTELDAPANSVGLAIVAETETVRLGEGLDE